MKATDSRNLNALGWLMILLILHICRVETMAQYPKIDEDIAKHRKGELIVKAKPGDKIFVEQLSHEFWFGCAISNGFVDGTMSPQDVKQYEQKFLKHFNSAVTENAVKWLSM